MNRRGFTIVELLITITIVGILLTLAVVNLRSTQINARDSERQADVENIAKYLETYYTSGSDTVASPYQYPSTAMTASQETIVATLRDIDPLVLQAPGVEGSAISLIAATSSSQTTPIAGSSTRPTIAEYVYQPLQTDNTLCTNDATQECRKFNLWYRLELDGSLQKIESRNR